MTTKRLWVGMTGVVAAGMFAVVLALFIWPGGGTDEVDEQVNLGPAEQFSPGDGLLYTDLVEFTDERWNVAILMTETPGFTAEPQPVRVALVRHEDGEFSAFLARDPRSGCTLAWRTDLESFGPGGFFRDPCHGSTYDEFGHRVFGPSPKDMDSFAVHVNNDGDVIVDLETLHEGARTPGAIDGGTPHPTVAPTARP